VRLRNGQYMGFIEQEDGTFKSGLYWELLRELINFPNTRPDGFILTVGVVSNHGNWFTSQNQNKELEVLAQSYDWLLFLTDEGLAQFVNRLLLNSAPELTVIRDTFLASYSGKSGTNRFTKVRIGLDADVALWNYFTTHSEEIDSWYNVISPDGSNIGKLRENLQKLADKSSGDV
jgi:hypothetical protein